MMNAHEIRDILKIGIEITTEKIKSRLLEKMLEKAMAIANCDAGTLYIVKDGALYFRIMKTLSMNVDKGKNGEHIDLPPVALKEENVCAYAALHKELINIQDVNHSEKFDFSGPMRYDKMTGYHTQSMLVVPMEDAEGNVIGVIQLINKLDGDGRIIRFADEDAFILRALGSMAAVSLSNMLYLDELKLQMDSFVQAFATAIDKRTPYNGSHTRMVTEYAVAVAKRLNESYLRGEGGERFEPTRIEQLRLAAILHDVGKMIVPLSVMNKQTRLGDAMETVNSRFRYLHVLYERDFYKGELAPEDFEEQIARLEADKSLIDEVDKVGFLSDAMLARIDEMASHCYYGKDGTVLPYLTVEELECLRIRKGTLTADERMVMESHASMTREILEKVHFTDTYKNALRFASEHHEFLDGSGYPNRLRGDEISTETRILTAVDIFDALTCTDRPYKKPMPRERAIAILKEMAAEGKLDAAIVNEIDGMARE